MFLQQFEDKLAKNPGMKIAAYDHPDGKTSFITTTAGQEVSTFAGYTNHPDADKDAKIAYVRVGMDMDGMDPDSYFKTVGVSAKASIFHVANNTGHPITQYGADFFSANASAGVSGVTGGNDGFPVYAGAGAELNLLDVNGAGFDAKVGLNAQTDIGFKDYSFGGHVLGAGFELGKRISVSTPFGSVGFDFGVFFP